LTTADDVMTAARCLDEDGDRFLRAAAWKIHCDSVDATSFETVDVGLHRRCVA
jgi:hypothetical protein